MQEIKSLFGNEEFVAKFNAVGDPDEIKALFKEYGVEISDEDLISLIKESVGEPAETELGEDALDDVSGGVVATLAKILAGTWAFAVKTYGSPENAVREIGLFWARKLGYKGKK